MSFIKPLKIGGFTCRNNLVLAPMAGITDTPFRIMCLKGGAGLVCAEMVSANAIKYANAKSIQMLKTDSKEHPLSMQVFGGDAQTIALACQAAQERGADIIDINAGCPVKKVNKSGAGCVLMKDPQKLAEIVSAAVKSVKVPVTLKTRVSLNRTDILAVLLAKIAQDNGAAAVTLHARAAVDMHSGPANLKALEDACKAVSIPVIGNGGVIDEASAKAMFETGVSGIMIGRGAIGNPFIFSELCNAFNGKAQTTLATEEKLKLFSELVEESVRFYGERTGISRSKKTVGYWVRNFEGSSAVREKFVRAETLKEAREILLNAAGNKKI